MQNEMSDDIGSGNWRIGWMNTWIHGSEDSMSEGIAYSLWREYSGDKEGYAEVTEGKLTGIPRKDVSLMMFAFRLGAYNMMDCFRYDSDPDRGDPLVLKSISDGDMDRALQYSLDKVVDVTERIINRYKEQVQEGRR